MSKLPTMEITIKLLFTPCNSGLLYLLTSTCSTKINDGEELPGKSGPLREFMPVGDLKTCAKSDIDITLRGSMTHIYCCNVQNGLRAFNAIIRRIEAEDRAERSSKP